MSAVQQQFKLSEGGTVRVSVDEDPFVEPNRIHAVQVGLHKLDLQKRMFLFCGLLTYF